jgi:hypothetical protein
MSATTIHVFAGKFRDRDQACTYSQEQWDETPVLLTPPATLPGARRELAAVAEAGGSGQEA